MAMIWLLILWACAASAGAQCMQPGEALAIRVRGGDPATCKASVIESGGNIYIGHNITRGPYTNFSSVIGSANVSLGATSTLEVGTLAAFVSNSLDIEVDNAALGTVLGSTDCRITAQPVPEPPFPFSSLFVFLGGSSRIRVTNSSFMATLSIHGATIDRCLGGVFLGGGEMVVDGSTSSGLVMSGSKIVVHNSVHSLTAFGLDLEVGTAPYPAWNVLSMHTYEIRGVFLAGSEHRVTLLGNDTTSRIEHVGIFGGARNKILLGNGRIRYCNIYGGSDNAVDISLPASLITTSEYNVVLGGRNQKIGATATATAPPLYCLMAGATDSTIQTNGSMYGTHLQILGGDGHLMQSDGIGMLYYLTIMSGVGHEFYVSVTGSVGGIFECAILTGHGHAMRVVGPSNFVHYSAIVAGTGHLIQADAGSGMHYASNAVVAGQDNNVTNSYRSVVLTGLRSSIDDATGCVVLTGTETRCTHNHAVLMNGVTSQADNEFRNSGDCHCGSFGLDDGGFLTAGTTGGAGVTIGTAATQKMAFWGKTPPVVQPAPTGAPIGPASAGVVAGFRDDTFTGGVGGTAYSLPDVIAALKAAGLLAM